MAGENTNSTLSLTKTVYGDKLEKLEFTDGMLKEFLPFKQKLGDTLKFPVQLKMEHGFVANGTSGSAATLATAVAQNIDQAEVSAYEVIGRSRIAYRIMEDAVARGPAAFESATSTVMDALSESTQFRLEHDLLYGHEGLGIVSSIDTGVITITNASWSAATWESLEGALLEAFTTTAATATQHDTTLTITAVDLDAKTVTVSGTSSSVAAGDILYFKGWKTTTSWNSMAGIRKIISNTGSLFGIDAATNSRWKGNTKSSMGTPNFLKFLQGLSKMTGRRLRRQNTTLLVPIAAFDILNSDLMAGRRFDGSYAKKARTGFETIEFAGSTGVTEIVPHPMVRDGDAMAFTAKNGFRTGSADIKWKSANGSDAADIWFPVDDVGANECRLTYIQAPAFLRPAHTVYFSGITYS